MIRLIPRFLSDKDIQRIVSLSGASHHTDEDGHISSSFRANKPYHQPWLADRILKSISDIDLFKMSEVDPAMQIYRLTGNQSTVSCHVDQDYSNEQGLVARYSILVGLNNDYAGGETRFFEKYILSPPLGGAIIFDHKIPHEGLLVSSGEKLVLKTDVFVE